MNITRAAGALVLLAVLPLGACSGPDVGVAAMFGSASGRVEPGNQALATPTTPSGSAQSGSAPSGSTSSGSTSSGSTSSGSTPTATPGGSSSSSLTVSPDLQLARRLRALTTSEWRSLHDARTGVDFALPGAVTQRRLMVNGIAERIYLYELVKQSGVSAGFAHAASPAAATAALPQYPDQLAAGLRAAGSDDAVATETRTTGIDGKPAIMFRMTFTPAIAPQVPSVWLVTAIADGANIVVLQTIIFPPSTDYDYLSPARQVQQRLVQSFDAS